MFMLNQKMCRFGEFANHKSLCVFVVVYGVKFEHTTFKRNWAGRLTFVVFFVIVAGVYAFVSSQGQDIVDHLKQVAATQENQATTNNKIKRRET